MLLTIPDIARDRRTSVDWAPYWHTGVRPVEEKRIDYSTLSGVRMDIIESQRKEKCFINVADAWCVVPTAVHRNLLPGNPRRRQEGDIIAQTACTVITKRDSLRCHERFIPSATDDTKLVPPPRIATNRLDRRMPHGRSSGAPDIDCSFVRQSRRRR